jgi:hypothetical protein
VPRAPKYSADPDADAERASSEADPALDGEREGCMTARDLPEAEPRMEPAAPALLLGEAEAVACCGL